MVRQRVHRNKGLRGPSSGSTRDKTKIVFFRAENLGYTNNRPSLSSTHRSVSPSGELSKRDGSPVRFFISTVGHRILSVFISTIDASILSPSSAHRTGVQTDTLQWKHIYCSLYIYYGSSDRSGNFGTHLHLTGLTVVLIQQGCSCFFARRSSSLIFVHERYK